jgi:hypothetical protein
VNKKLILIPLIFIILGMAGYTLYSSGAFIENKINLSGKLIPKEVIDSKRFEIVVNKNDLNQYSSIYANDKLIQLENSKYYIDLVSGENNINIYSKNLWGQKSNIENLKINNYPLPAWSKYECNGLIFGFDNAKLQLGYSGANGQNPEILNKEASFKAYQVFDCDSKKDKSNNTVASIFSKGQLAGCWFCDGNSGYINISKKPSLQNNPSVDLINKYSGSKLISTKIYNSANGIEFLLTTSTKSDNPQVKNYRASFNLNSDQYIIESSIYTPEQGKNLEVDFYDIINRIQLPDSILKYQSEYSSSDSKLTFIEPDLNGFTFDYHSSWSLRNSLVTTPSELPTTNKTSRVLELSRGEYKIIFDIGDNKSARGGGIFTPKELETYKPTEIDKLNILLPIPSKVQSTYSYSNNGYALVKVPLSPDNYNFYAVINNKSYQISIQYSGNNFDPNNSVRTSDNYDTIIDKEVEELFMTLKWGSK